MSRTEVLTDVMWAQIEPLLPPLTGRLGRPRAPYRPLVEGAIFRLRTGVAWRDLPREFGPCQTVWKRQYEFCNDGTLLTEPPPRQHVSSCLGHMSAVADETRGTGDPALLFKNDGVYILDPFLLFFLRWGTWPTAKLHAARRTAGLLHRSCSEAGVTVVVDIRTDGSARLRNSRCRCPQP